MKKPLLALSAGEIRDAKAILRAKSYILLNE
jgi:hypothetical protein